MANVTDGLVLFYMISNSDFDLDSAAVIQVVALVNAPATHGGKQVAKLGTVNTLDNAIYWRCNGCPSERTS